MPAFLIPLAMMAASAISGALANRKQKQTSTVTPTMAPEYTPLQASLLRTIEARLAKQNQLPAGYESSQIRNINNTFGLAGQTLSNRMTARGLASSPVAGMGDATMQSARAGQIATMQSGLPLLNRQLGDQNIGLAQSLMALGRGTTGTTETPSNMLGGGFASAADMLAYLYGKGAFGGGKGKTPLKTKPLPVSYLPLPSAPAGNYTGEW